MSLLFSLYITFLKIGALAYGGGYATIPLIQRFVIEENGWLNMTEFVDVVAISQMTPGPIAINTATFVGQKIGGLPGSIFATAGVVTPQFILMMILGHFLFTKNKKFKLLDWILNGIKAGIVSMILITAINLIESSIFPNGFSAPEIAALVSFIIGFILYLRGENIMKLIALGAVLGLGINILL